MDNLKVVRLPNLVNTS